jgi:D-proline reductase (dithiol) PrdB
MIRLLTFMELIEKLDSISNRFSLWNGRDNLNGYTFVENRNAPFTPLKSALPMANIALITSAGAYIDGTEPFDTTSRDGDASFREIPIEVEAEDLKFAGRGYDTKYVHEDINCQIPVQRLLEYEANGVIAKLNNVWWTMNGFIPNVSMVAEQLAPKIVERMARYEINAALLVPASRLCHQTMAVVARAIEMSGIPTMMLSVDKNLAESIRPPRAAYYNGDFGCVVGKPNWSQFQLRVLDESLRWIETFDQPTAKRLTVLLETEVEQERGEK